MILEDLKIDHTITPVHVVESSVGMDKSHMYFWYNSDVSNPRIKPTAIIQLQLDHPNFKTATKGHDFFHIPEDDMLYKISIVLSGKDVPTRAECEFRAQTTPYLIEGKPSMYQEPMIRGCPAEQVRQRVTQYLKSLLGI